MNTNSIDQKGLTVKDLITTGIFSALFVVFTLAGGMFFAMNPVLTFYMPFATGLICGPIYLFLVAKVHKRWSITILGALVGIIMFATGMHWAMALGYVVMGIIADILAGTGEYKSKRKNILSYMLLSLGATGSYLVYFMDPVGWAGTMLKNGTDQSYINVMNASAPSRLPLVIIAGTLIMACISGIIGYRMLKKQFEKAGLLDD